MEGPSLVQQFRFIVSLASLAYTFTVLHTLQYTMRNQRNQDDSTTGTQAQNQQDHDSNLSSTNDTTNTSGTSEKNDGRWTEQEIYLLLNYIEQNSILTTARGLNLKKSEFNNARNMIKSKDASQCHYKWGKVSILLINDLMYTDFLSIVAAMFYL